MAGVRRHSWRDRHSISHDGCYFGPDVVASVGGMGWASGETDDVSAMGHGIAPG